MFRQYLTILYAGLLVSAETGLPKLPVDVLAGRGQVWKAQGPREDCVPWRVDGTPAWPAEVQVLFRGVPTLGWRQPCQPVYKALDSAPIPERPPASLV